MEFVIAGLLRHAELGLHHIWSEQAVTCADVASVDHELPVCDDFCPINRVVVGRDEDGVVRRNCLRI